MRPLNVLIGCECSGRVREAFRALGHNAWSCDVKPAEDWSAYHIQGDLVEVMKGSAYGTYLKPWDLLIAHPPCTYLCNSGVRWFTTIPKIQRPGVRYGAVRWQAMREAVKFFADLYTADVPYIALENPIMHGHAAAVIATHILGAGLSGSVVDGESKPTQTIQPYEYGHGESKRTGLWLKGLPKLQPTKVVEGREGKVWRMAPGPNRAADRARTYQGIADAMAEQWGRFVQERINANG